MKKSIFTLASLLTVILCGCTENAGQILEMTEINILTTTDSGTANTRSSTVISQESLKLADGLWADMVIAEESEIVTRAQQNLPENVAVTAKVYEGTSLITTVNYKTVSGGKAIIENGTNASEGVGVIERGGKKYLVLLKNKKYRFVAYTDKTSASPDESNVYSESISENVMNYCGDLQTNTDNVTLPIVFKRVLSGLRFRIISKHIEGFTKKPDEITVKENMCPSSANWNWQSGMYEAATLKSTTVKYNVCWDNTPYSEGGVTTDSYTMTNPMTMLPGALNKPFKFETGPISIGDFRSAGAIIDLTGIPRMQGNKSYKVNLFIKVSGMQIIIEGENESGSEPA